MAISSDREKRKTFQELREWIVEEGICAVAIAMVGYETGVEEGVHPEGGSRLEPAR